MHIMSRWVEINSSRWVGSSPAGSGSPDGSPRMGLVRSTDMSSNGGSSPQLRRRASIVAAKSFKSDGKSEAEAQVDPANTSLGKFRQARRNLVGWGCIRIFASCYFGLLVICDIFLVPGGQRPNSVIGSHSLKHLQAKVTVHPSEVPLEVTRPVKLGPQPWRFAVLPSGACFLY